jgi:hypothetical protein
MSILDILQYGVSNFIEQATAEDYHHLLRTVARWVTIE